MKKRVFKKHLESAERYFIAKNYEKALFEYSLARHENPDSQDVKIGILLCDLAHEMENEAHSLFDYYMIAKKESAENAAELLEKIILSIDGALSATAELLTPPLKDRLDYENAISYDDFLKIVEKRGDFKRAFEDIMFSTRVVISEKKDFISFLESLVANGFNEMAMNYLESASAIFPSNKKIRDLFDKLNRKETVETKTPKKSNSSVEFISDNSSECDSNTAFLITPLSAKYLDDAKARGVSVFVGANELKDIFDLSSIKIIGITGTNGKTTTAAAIYSLLLDSGKKVALQGTRGFFINDERVEEKSLTTPMQLNIFANILTAIERGCEYFVMEVSSHAIAQKRIEGLSFALKIITNITQDHLDFHKTFENYRDTKNEFLSDESVKLVNIDDENIVFNSKNAKTYGLEKHADYKVGAYSLNDGIFAVIEHCGANCSLHASMAGVFNIYNITAAVAAVHILTNEKLETICENVENFGGVGGRMEIISQSPLVVVDFAHTPDGIAKVLEALGGSKITVVFGAGGDRDKSKRPLMGKEAALRAAKLIITSDNPRSEEPSAIIADILDGIEDKSKVSVVEDRYEAIKKAILEQKEDEIVAILGKGDESSQIFKDRTIHFDDRETAREILKQKTATA